MLNKVDLMGRLVHTPEVKTSDKGNSVARLRIACDRDITGQDGEKTDFFDVTAFGKTADFAGKYLQKGRLCAVTGRLQNRQYTDKDGNKRTATAIVADHLYFADSPAERETPEKPKEPFLAAPPREIPEQPMIALWIVTVQLGLQR